MTRSGPALGALGSLPDRSLVRIAEASADARTYDRQGTPDKVRYRALRSFRM